MTVPPLPRPGLSGRFFEAYTQGMSTAALERLFTLEAPEAYRFFSRQIDAGDLTALPWYRRTLVRVRLLFLAVTLKLTPARRALFGAALLAAGFGVVKLMDGVSFTLIPHPAFASGTLWLLAAFALVNLLFLLEIADRLTLKNDLEIARDIQQAMLPRGAYVAPSVEAFGMTRPANTVGGDFYDIFPLDDGRIVVALGDVAGKGSPAALLMALLLAMMRTLIDEGVHGAALAARLNAQIARHAPGTRFITCFIAIFNPATGTLTYVNAGQNPPLLRRTTGRYEQLRTGGVALGLFEGTTYTASEAHLAPGDLLVMYSDGITEAEDAAERPFDEHGLTAVIESNGWASAKELGWATFAAVEHHVGARRLADDLTVLVMRRLPALPTI